MKCFKDGVMYVEPADVLYKVTVPAYVSEEIGGEALNSKEALIRFESKNSIRFWNEQKDVLNYLDVKKLSDDELKTKIAAYTGQIKKLESEWFLAFLYYRHLLDLYPKLKKLQHKKDTLERYLESREKIDRLFTV